MASTVAQRMELAKFCSSKDWSKAIRVLDSLLSQSSSSIQDICNRAFCYSQLELHKHAVKDCDRALQLDPTLLQAHILKGRAFSALGRNEEAVLIWEQGFEHALRQSADLKQLLELEELLSSAKQGNSVASSVVAESPGSSHSSTESVPLVSGKVSTKKSETSENCKMSNGELVSLRKSEDQIPNSHETNDRYTVPLVSAKVSTKTSEASENYKMSNGELVSLRESEDQIHNSHEANDRSTLPLVSAKVSTKTRETSEDYKMSNGELVSLRKSEDQIHNSHEANDRSTVPLVSAKVSTKTSETSEDYKMSNAELELLLRKIHKSHEASEDFKMSNADLQLLRKMHKSNEASEDYKMSNAELQLLRKMHKSHETNDRSTICIDSKEKSPKNKKHHGRANGIHEKQQNGTLKIDSIVSNGDSKSKVPTQLSFKVSTSDAESSCSVNIRTQPGTTKGKHDERSDVSTKGKKIRVARISKKSINVDFRLSRGIARVNEGNYVQAISIFDQILKEEPTYSEALIGRGTAYAFRRELDSAISDFTKAIQANPAAGEAWKRRGQAKAALGESSAAISDLTKALEYEQDSADVLHERGIVNFKFKDFAAAAEDLSACLITEKSNKSAYTYLGLALSSLGEYAKAEEAHKKAIQLDQSFLEAWAHLAQLYQELANWEKGFDCLEQILKIDRRYTKAYHLRGLLFHAMGEHKSAIKELSAGLSVESSNVECLYLRASCYHAVGDYREAVKDYDAALDLELDSMEKFVLQCMAFYQKEIALYTASKLNSEFCWFDIDGDIDPLFKEYWCKRLHPKNVCEKVYRQPTLRDSLRKAKARKQEFSMTKQKTTLLQVADSIGKKIQYYCPGFLPNKRQHRMAGLAAIEIAQKVSKAWRSLQMELKQSSKGTAKSGRKVRRREKFIHSSQNRGGAGCSTSSLSEMSTPYGGSSEEKSSMRSIMSWHDVYNLAVKWRQISEPCDPVVWVNKLSMEEFSAGFGSHTPLVVGQIKVARYFPNFPRVMNAAKMVIKERKYVCDKKDNLILLSDDGKLREIMNADSCSDLYKAIGQDFWLSTWCNSTAVEGKSLEGTRITLVKKEEKGFDFAIRTPCTPARWEDFDLEMMAAWEALCDLYCGDTFGTTDYEALENVRNAILRITYYWYNFMPLSRGSAVVGFVVLLGLLLAANMEFSGSVPKGTQVDWEAILNFDPKPFSESVKSWLYPCLKISTAWKGYPDVASTFETTGSVVNALSTFSD